jgi:hypothetical protein
LSCSWTQALCSNPRIDGLYLYISTSTADVLAQRQKQRLAEADSTLAKRLAWAKQQVAKSSTAGLFDDIIPNTSLAEVSVNGSSCWCVPWWHRVLVQSISVCAHTTLDTCHGVGWLTVLAFVPAGLCSPEGGNQQAEPHHPQQVCTDGMLRALLAGAVSCRTCRQSFATRPAASVLHGSQTCVALQRFVSADCEACLRMCWTTQTSSRPTGMLRVSN